MRARYHGEQIPSIQAQLTDEAFALGPTVGFMFGDLTDDPYNRLPESQETINAVAALGRAMAEDPSNEESNIPAAYTYFGQFIDHDITLTVFDPAVQPPGGPDPIQTEKFKPIKRTDLPSVVQNLRSAPLDLDSVYTGHAEEAIQPDGRFRLSEVSELNFFPITMADRFHDLPRRPMIEDPQTDEEQQADRQALIGDPRNDENLLVAQLHLGILRSHNALIERGMSPPDAKQAIRRRYQWAVLHDFLPRVCDQAVAEDVLSKGPTFWIVDNADDLFMPIEFSAAGYRFGHSMIRGEYSHNSTFSPPPGQVRARFNFFFTFTALSGDIQPGPGPNFQFPTLPDNWPIEWHRYFGTATSPATNLARKIDSNLTPELGNLRNVQGIPIEDVMGELAARNLLRGYLLGLPTGQAVANRLGIQPLSRDVLERATPTGLKDLVDAAGLFDRTPLWLYILAKSGDPSGANGQHLGIVGSRIVAETLWNLARHATDSIIATPPTEAELETGEFTLSGLIKIGQDAGMPPIGEIHPGLATGHEDPNKPKGTKG